MFTYSNRYFWSHHFILCSTIIFKDDQLCVSSQHLLSLFCSYLIWPLVSIWNWWSVLSFLNKVSFLVSCYSTLTWFVCSLSGQSFSTRIPKAWVVFIVFAITQNGAMNNLEQMSFYTFRSISLGYILRIKEDVHVILTVIWNCPA